MKHYKKHWWNKGQRYRKVLCMDNMIPFKATKDENVKKHKQWGSHKQGSETKWGKTDKTD